MTQAPSKSRKKLIARIFAEWIRPKVIRGTIPDSRIPESRDDARPSRWSTLSGLFLGRKFGLFSASRPKFGLEIPVKTIFLMRWRFAWDTTILHLFRILYPYLSLYFFFFAFFETPVLSVLLCILFQIPQFRFWNFHSYYRQFILF